MRTHAEHEYTTYPRRFDSYKGYKPLLVAVLFILFLFIAQISIDIIVKSLFGTIVNSTGYDDMDFFSAAGAFDNGAKAASVVPCIILAALVVKDRPVSSYFSSMGGWRWTIFFKTLAAAMIILGIPTIVMHLVQGRTGDLRFTMAGFIIITLTIPFQGIGEELVCRSYIMQTVSSWFMLPVVGIIAQAMAFAAVHPYNIIGIVEIAVSGILYALIVIFSGGIESSSALHIVNNMSEIYMVGVGFGSITAEQTITPAAVNLLFKTLFFIFILYADKKLHWFDEAKYDDVERFNARRSK